MRPLSRVYCVVWTACMDPSLSGGPRAGPVAQSPKLRKTSDRIKEKKLFLVSFGH
jgi:hypothetical protein